MWRARPLAGLRLLGRVRRIRVLTGWPVAQAVEPERPETPAALLAAFDAMVDAQIAATQSNAGGPRRHHQRKLLRRAAVIGAQPRRGRPD